MPTATLTLASTASNYSELNGKLRDRLTETPTTKPSSDIWDLTGQSAKAVNGLTVLNTGSNVQIGKLDGNRSNFRNLNFQIVNNGSRRIDVDKATIKSSSFTSDGTGVESIIFGSEKFSNLRRVNAQLGLGNDYLELNQATSKASNYDLGDGSDSVVFRADARSTDDNFELGDGADTVTFAAGARAKDVIVDLGDDSAADLVDIELGANDKDGVSGVIDNFGTQDTLQIGGEIYNYNRIKGIYDAGDVIGNGDLHVNLKPQAT